MLAHPECHPGNQCHLLLHCIQHPCTHRYIHHHCSCLHGSIENRSTTLDCGSQRYNVAKVGNCQSPIPTSTDGKGCNLFIAASGNDLGDEIEESGGFWWYYWCVDADGGRGMPGGGSGSGDGRLGWLVLATRHCLDRCCNNNYELNFMALVSDCSSVDWPSKAFVAVEPAAEAVGRRRSRLSGRISAIISRHLPNCWLYRSPNQ